MAIEIERKFLVSGDGWKAHVISSRLLTDGLLLRSGGRKVRVRIDGDRATLAFKGEREGAQRPEFEYEIPLCDAEELIALHCIAPILKKRRYTILNNGQLWEVDCYASPLIPEVLADAELSEPNAPLDLPTWIGREITDDQTYSKRVLAQRILDGAPQDLDPVKISAA